MMILLGFILFFLVNDYKTLRITATILSEWYIIIQYK